jgi:hypothetical protein
LLGNTRGMTSRHAPKRSGRASERQRGRIAKAQVVHPSSGSKRSPAV